MRLNSSLKSPIRDTNQNTAGKYENNCVIVDRWLILRLLVLVVNTGWRIVTHGHLHVVIQTLVKQYSEVNARTYSDEISNDVEKS